MTAEQQGWVVVGPMNKPGMPRFEWSAWAEAGSQQGSADSVEEGKALAEAALGRLLDRGRRGRMRLVE